MPGNERQPRLIHSFLAEAEESRLLDLLDYLEEKIPAAYRVELLSYLLPRAIPDEAVAAAPGRVAAVPGAIAEEDARAERPAAGRHRTEEEGVVGLESYLALFARRGDTLLKALASLRFAEAHLGVRWLTPTEIVRLLGELDDAHKVYRSNVSNALRKEESMVARRPRGRGYEYGLTKQGRARVMRELSLLGIDR